MNWLQPGRLVIALAVMVFSFMGPDLPAARASTGSSSSGYVHLEDESMIQRRQYPEQYPAELMLPDLRTLMPSNLNLVIEEDTGRKNLRFSNAVWNAGPGTLEVHGNLDQELENVSVMQIVYREDSTQLERPAGEFHFHADHGHFHWHDFSRYQVWSVLPDGSLDRVRASSGKVGFCLRDIAPYEMTDEEQGSLEGAEAPTQAGYTSCYWRRQGLSVGWYDIYRAHISGQSLDITHLEDGLYVLISTVDPTNRLREGDESNNSTMIYFQLLGDQIALQGEVRVQAAP